MKFFIDHTALERLTDPKLEIRQNALKEITSIIKNNVLIERTRNPYANEEFSVVNLEVLTKQLIRWFKHRPVTNELEVFELLILIFSREDFLRHITKSISLQRLRKELIKISKLLIPEESSKMLQKIEELLNKFENGILVDIANETGSFMDVKSSELSSIHHANRQSLMDRMRLLNLSPTSSGGSKCDENEVNCDPKSQEYWVNLEGENLETFISIDNELINFKDHKRLNDIINFLSASIDDFPPEFFIQPPNVLESLVDILPQVSKINSIEILQLINFIINGLKSRFMEAAKQNFKYIPTKKHMNKIIQMFTNFFERFHDNFTVTDLNTQQEVLNAIYLTLFDIVDFVECTDDICDLYLNELLNMLAKVVQDFRRGYDNGEIYRLNYIISIYLINAFVSRINVDQITEFSQTNLWEYESDLALLDFTLSRSHKQIYNLIKKNRRELIGDDKDMMLMLNIEGTWKPVAELFQNWETFKDEQVIYKGLKCIDTIRIHKSFDLVELLFKYITKCAEKFNKMEKLKRSAEEIVLRLLSIDDQEIRIKTYSIARRKVQEKLTEDQEERTRDMDICVILGIPMSTEIVTEILCFGYSDSNEDIYKNSKLILFALLRSKVVFPNHWAKIFEVIHPVLPLMSCLFKTDLKLGFFSFDIFHEYSGFDKAELCQAFVRFLFTGHAKAREMAKIKLFENLELDEFSSEYIEIIPDNFCILPDGQVSDLQIPDRNVRYDLESYETVKKVLSSINHDEADILQSVLLQLSIQMNSFEICQQSHNDHLWVFFMANNLEMGHPTNAIVRKLTINILYKWVVTVSSFRVYLSNVPSVLKFLIKTLIYWQDDQQIKMQASSLLFLLAFSDFVVTNDKIISLPKFLKNLQCPFKFQEHWTESPFNKITQIELLYEALETCDEDLDAQEATMSYLRFSFASAWLYKNPHKIYRRQMGMEFYYQDVGNKTLKFSEKLCLTDKDYRLQNDSMLSTITSNTCKSLDNMTTVSEMVCLVNRIACSLMLPNTFITSYAEELENRVKKFFHSGSNQTENRKYMLIKCLELYQKLAAWLNDAHIIGILEREPISMVYGRTELKDENVYIQVLKLVNCIIKICETRKELAAMIIKSFNSAKKVHFPSFLVEKLCENLFEVAMKDRSWSSVTKIPSVKIIFTVLRNILRIMPIELDQTYVNEIFTKLIKASREFLKCKKKSHLNTHTVNQIFGIVEALTSLPYNFNLKNEHFSTLFLWIKEDETVHKALVWSTIGNLTKKKDDFTLFCVGFNHDLGFSLLDVLFERIFNTQKKQDEEQKAMALVIGNYLDHSTNKNELRVATDKRMISLISKFLDQKPLSYEIMSFLAKKMIQNKIPEVKDIVMKRRIIEDVLGNSLETSDLVILCYSYDGLKEYSSDLIVNIESNRLLELILALKNSTNCDALKSGKSQEYKKVNQNVLNIILVAITQPDGMHKVRKLMRFSHLFEKVFEAVYSGLKVTNPLPEVIFHMKFLNSLLNGYAMVKAKIDKSIFGRYEQKIRHNERFQKIIKEMGESGKSNNSILEKYIHEIHYGCDFFLLQAVDVFNCGENLKQNSEAKYEMRLSAFVFIRNLLDVSDQAGKFANDIKLQELILDKVKIFLKNPLNIPSSSYTEAIKKYGVQKCQNVIKTLCIFLKAITEWKLAVPDKPGSLKDLYDNLKAIYSWVENDSILFNCFLQFVQHISSSSIMKSCIMQEINGMTMFKGILKKIQGITTKIPHTETNLMILQNGLLTIEKCSHMVDVRLILKNSKIFQVIDLLHPQIQLNKKTTWNDVTIMWLQFFEVLSRFEDCECTPGQISLLCRIVRIGNQPMKLSALKIIRNLSMKSSLGYVVLISDDFVQTIDTILLEDGSKDEKMFILQTLLSIASKSEQSRSKLKNSSFSRKLKEHLVALEMVLDHTHDDEIVQLYNLTVMLKNILYM